MEALKTTRKVVYKIDYNNWNRFVSEYFDLVSHGKIGNQEWTDLGYEIVAVEELQNYSKFEYEPDGEIDDYDRKEYIEPLLGDTMNYVPLYSTRAIMDYFVQKGILDKGKRYQIDISW